MQASSNSFNSSFSGLENFIQYSEVTEVSPGNGYITYKYTNYESNPDENAYNTVVLIPLVYPYIDNVHLWNSYIGIKFNDKYFERGIPYDIKYYKENPSGPAVLVKEKKTTAFTGAADFPDAYLVGVHMTGGVAQSYKTYYYPFLPKTVQEITYNSLGQNPVTVQTDYEYNSQGHLTEETVIASNGDEIKTSFKYPYDYTSSSTISSGDWEAVGISKMLAKNLINVPIEVIKQNDGKVVESSLNLYKNFEPSGSVSFIAPHQVLRLNATSPLTLSTTPSGTTFTKSSVSVSGGVGSFTKDNFYEDDPLQQIIKYDEHGNVLEASDQSKTSICYIWSYHYSLPVAKITNATYSEVTSAVASLGSSFLTNLGNSDTQTFIESSLASLRTEIVNDLPAALIETYTHDPLIGMKSYTDPAGVMINYEYDLYGRLRNTRDSAGKLINAYEYHYIEP